MARELFHQNAAKVILAAIFLMIFFSIRITNLLIILYIINWLAGGTAKAWRWQERDWLVLLVISPWLLELVSVLYSTNKVVGFHQIEKRLALIAIPIVTLHSLNNTVNDRLTVFRVATKSTVLATTYCLGLSLFNFFINSTKLAYWEDFTEPIIIDSSYVSLLINILSIWIIYELVSGWNSLSQSNKFYFLGLITFFGVIEFFLASKLHGVIFIALLILGLLMIYGKNNIGWRYSTLILLLLFAIGLAVTKSDIKERFSHIENFTIPKFDAPDEEFNELTLRLAIFKASMFILKDNLVFGTGVGDVLSDLEFIYRQLDFKFGYNNAYDPHNQYLRVCLGTGLLGLIFFLISLITIFILALRSYDWLTVGIMMVFCLSFLFESVLERHSGILIYAFFISVLVFGNDRTKRLKPGYDWADKKLHSNE